MKTDTTRKLQRGARGPKGAQGARGERGAPGITHDALESLEKTVEALRSESVIQLQRIADLQAQLDIALAQFKRLREGK